MSPPILLPLPNGYDPGPACRYHGRDPEGLCERVEENRIHKALDIDGRVVRLSIEFGPDAASLSIDTEPGTGCAERMTVIARRMLGLIHDSGGLEARARQDPEVARLIAGRPGLRLPQTATVFEGVVWAIVGQQVNLTFAGALRRTLIELAGRPHGSGMIAHPTPDAVAALDASELTGRRFSRSKADYLLGVARLVAEGRLDLEGLPALSQEEAAARLTGIRGVGPWTIQYVLLRACGFPDCAPAGDAGLAAALQKFHGMDRRPTPEEQRQLMARYAPYRSLATAYLWASLG